MPGKNKWDVLNMHANGIKEILQEVNYSKAGSSKRVKEEATYMLFLDLLYYCEGTYCAFCVLSNDEINWYVYIDEESPEVTLGEVLNFFTGATYLLTTTWVWCSSLSLVLQQSLHKCQHALCMLVYVLKNHGARWFMCWKPWRFWTAIGLTWSRQRCLVVFSSKHKRSSSSSTVIFTEHFIWHVTIPLLLPYRHTAHTMLLVDVYTSNAISILYSLSS